MKHELRERLTGEFSGVIKSVREEKWSEFKAAASQINVDPYVALARLLVRIVEDIIEKKSEDNGKGPSQ